MDASNLTDAERCSEEIPFSSDIFRDQSQTGLVLVVINWICVFFILAVFFLEIAFVIRRFQTSYRKRNTICVLGLCPVYSVCAIIGIMIPRSSLLVDLVANSYYALSIYCLMGLIEDFLGTQTLHNHPGIDTIRINTFPVCCCCPCLPQPEFNRKTYLTLLVMIYQVTVFRPVISFMSAVLWADGQYVPGQLTASNAFTYLTLLNLTSTTFAVWGLVIVQTAFKEHLVKYAIGLKFLYLQLTLLGTSLGNIVIGALVSKGVIPCASYMPSTARAARIDNSYVVFYMCLVSLCGLVAFRRVSDGIVDRSDDYRRRRSII